MSIRAVRFLSACMLAFLVSACDRNLLDLSENTAVSLGMTNPSVDCENRNPLRNAYFGDLHVHTAYSSDAYGYGVRLSPRDAYRYAFGETVYLPPNDDQQQGTRPTRIDRPLDFAGVTDHAELLGEVQICSTQGMQGYWSLPCLLYRWWPSLAYFMMNNHATKRCAADMRLIDAEFSQ